MDKALAVQLVKLGIPASLQGTLVSLSFMVLMTVANGVAGLTGSAALSIAGKVNSVAILPSLAMQASVSSMAGQNIGAGKPERAKKTMFVAMGMSFVFSALMFAVVNLFPAGIASLFMSGDTDPAIVSASAEYLRVISWDYLITSILFCINGLAMGAGQTLFSLLNGCVSSLLVRIPAAVLFGQVLHFGLNGVGLAAPSASLVGLVVGVVYLCTGSWRRAHIKGVPETVS